MGIFYYIYKGGNNLEKLLKGIMKNIEDAFVECGYDRRFGFVSISNRPDLCQYQCNGALGAAKLYKKAPTEIAHEVICRLKNVSEFSDVSFASPGFINIALKDSVFTEYVNKMKGDSRLGVDICEIPRKIIIDF